MDTTLISSPPKYFRTGRAAGVRGRIDKKGGYRGAGLIEGVSVITAGEALGHDLWIDDAMLSQVVDAINMPNKGIKSRFTHPDISGDGLGKFVGRMMSARLEGNQVVADQHFSEAGHNTPDGDLAGYLLALAEEDPDAYGLSIVFARDFDAEDDFTDAHSSREQGFISPDSSNRRNLTHARVAQLRAVDAVDEPAANPSGLFHRETAIFADAESIASYALGLTSEMPRITALGLDPERVRGFTTRFLSSHALEIKPMPSNVTEPVVDSKIETTVNDTSPVDDVETSVETPEEPIVAARTGQDYLDAFGTQGGVWFAQGKPWDECVSDQIALQAEEIANLKQQLTAAQSGESSPVEFQPENRGKKAGLRNRIRIQGKNYPD